VVADRRVVRIMRARDKLLGGKGAIVHLQVSRAMLPALVFFLMASPGFVAVDRAMDSTVLAVASEAEASPDFEYRNFTVIRDILFGLEAQYPEIAKVYDIGDSWETTQGIAERDIFAIKISDNVPVDEDEPEVLIMSLHHAREWITSELVTELLINITSSYGHDARISWLVDNRELWVVPVVNPDGLEYSLDVDPMWRKNRRLNWDFTYGVDLNRNYNGSENGDPLGAWGGAGTSDTPGDSTYCGEAPFSEPETQAIRDLVYARDFQIGLDIHSYSELVMWPWGYTGNVTPDDDSLSGIGGRLAAVNGYVPAQSVLLYPTTGDSLDWLYGGADAYSILFEIGTKFHPSSAAEAWEVINENIPALMLGIELAGDRDLAQFSIHHTPVATRPWSSSGHVLEAEVQAERGVAPSSVMTVYRVDGSVWAEMSMENPGPDPDVYVATVPAQPAGSFVEYYFVARDLGGVEKMSPIYAPYELHSYTVTPVSAPPTADAGADLSPEPGAEVTFDGSDSWDDVGIVNYTWTFVYDGEPVKLHGVAPEFVFNIPGIYDVTLTVLDEEGQSGTDQVVVTMTEIPEMGSAVALAAACALAVTIVAIGRFRRRGHK